MNKKAGVALFVEIFQVLLGVFIASIGLKAFLLPNGFLDGGVTGIAILLSEKLAMDISYLLVVVSIPFLIIGWFTVSLRILLKSIVSILLLSISISLETFPVITEDKLLIAIFGGLFLGAGIGIAIRNGAVLDGSEILGVYFFEKFGIDIGKTILIFNIILFGITAIILSQEIAMYSILTYIITAKVIDTVIKGFEDFIGFTIVSNQSIEIEEALLKEIRAGVTTYQGSTSHGSSGSRKSNRIIHTVVNRIDIRKTYNVVNKIDPNAFIVEFDVNKVHGGVQRHYLSARKHRKLHSTIT